MIRILLYSKDSKLRPLLASALGADLLVVSESSSDRVQQLLSSGNCDVLLFDLNAAEATADEQVQFYEKVSGTGVAVIVLTDDVSRPVAVDLVQRGAHAYCRKPPALRELKSMIRKAYEHVSMRRELERKSNDAVDQPAPIPTCDRLMGGSAQMENVFELIRRVGNLNASVLVTGESGTGKELIARAIHNLGDRAKNPFVAVSCGAIPETLMEAELFGHEKGAFTGTTGTRVGFFEQAGNGTLFVDEIGELSLQTQVKLLRVLQEREFTRLGNSRPIPLRARIIFATHRDLNSMIAEGKFRLDLYYRINVMTIQAPALADRPEDIPALADHFLAKYSEIYGKYLTAISHRAMKAFKQYDWPGNVRELENVIQGSIIRANGTTLEPEDLPKALQNVEAEAEDETPRLGSFERMLRDYKVKIAMKAIEDCKGNKTLAARSLDISRAYLHRLIRSSDVQNIDAA